MGNKMSWEERLEQGLDGALDRLERRMARSRNLAEKLKFQRAIGVLEYEKIKLQRRRTL